MIGINDGILQYCLFLIFLNPNSGVLCDGAKELKKNTIKFCDVPTLLPHTNITYQCTRYIKNPSKSCAFNGTVFESTAIKISCDAGYSTDATVSFCSGNEWVPPITGCSKKCKKLNPVNVHLECFRKNISIPCDEKYLVSGVTVRPTCDHLSSSGFQFYPGHQEIHCKEDGNWDNDLLSCVQDCGRLENNSSDSKTWSMPWDVVIYAKWRYVLVNICFGTIISPRVILTSEYCMLTKVYDESDYKSMSQNPLDPAIFNVAIKNDFDYRNITTWQTRMEFFTYTLFGPSSEDNAFIPIKVKEFRYVNNGNQDKSLFHDALIVIVEKEISFNSHLHPACVQWKTPNRLNITTGIAKVQQWNGDGEEFVYKDYSFLSHGACQENPAYPFFVSKWATFSYYFDTANRDFNDIKPFRLDSTKNNQTALHNKGKLFCLEQKQDQRNQFLTLSGSGVMIEKDHRYFIRGIAGDRFLRDLVNNHHFKNFMKVIHYIANKSYEDFSKNISYAIINGLFDRHFVEKAIYLFNYNYPSLLRNHLESAVTAKLPNSTQMPIIIGVTDIADYVDWIKHVVAEVDPHYTYNLST
ncbi:uncharacterized protein LOC135840322 isoform X1 [Planococcus citri]|uniref:uncharacterized protein LOC135840322 isoform X1 n=1 Tax=Planococcus citri TaxID=170843 RepID=UPI0031F9DA20